MADKNRRSAWSVQDLISGKANSSGSKYHSNYSGPKKSSTSVTGRIDLSKQPLKDTSGRIGGITGRSIDEGSGLNGYAGKRKAFDGGMTGSIGYIAPMQTGGVMDYAWIMVAVLLLICVATALISFKSVKSASNARKYPSNVATINGVVNDILEEYYSVGLGTNYQLAQARAAEEAANPDEEATSNMLGEVMESTTPNTTTGATMNLDDGTVASDYPEATDYATLCQQLTDALRNGKSDFVGTKLCYEDTSNGQLVGYPSSVVEHFVEYMQANADKCDSFISKISDEEYATSNNGIYLVKLPLLQFTVNMGYDNTTLAISGFSDLLMNAGDSAVVSPLLPCMYDVSVSTDAGSQTSQVECNMSEGNLKINIGVTK